MVKGAGKRAYHRRDMSKVNRTALTIGGAVATLILILMIFSFLS